MVKFFKQIFSGDSEEEWKLNKEILTGIDIIDEQHYYFFLLYTKVFRLKEYNEPVTKEIIVEIAEDLEHYLDKHFQCEEFIMYRYLKGDAITDKQEHEHTRFMERCEKNIKEIKEGKDKYLQLGENLFSEILDWFYAHIVHSDMELGKQLLKNGYNSEDFVIPEDFKNM